MFGGCGSGATPPEPFQPYVRSSDWQANPSAETLLPATSQETEHEGTTSMMGGELAIADLRRILSSFRPFSPVHCPVFFLDNSLDF